jgi:hypothetical protein
MLRKDLADRLELVSPALAKNDLLPVLTHFAFTGDNILAYNGSIGISVPLKTEFVGAVPGKLLMDLLGASLAKELEFIDKNADLEIKAASSRFKLPVMSEDTFVFDMPKPSDKLLPVPLKQFARALEGCLRSVSTEQSVADQQGITLIADGDELSLFSTNNATISTNTLKLTAKPSFKERIILPALFCEQLVKLTADAKDCKLEVHSDYALLSTGRGVRCFGRFLNSPKPLDFQSHVDDSLKGTSKLLCPIPSKMRLIVERAIIITKTEKAMTNIRVKGGIMYFESNSGRGEVIDTVQVDQDDAALTLDPKHLKVGMGSFYDADEAKSGSMLMTDQCFIMARGSDYYLMAGSSLS